MPLTSFGSVTDTQRAKLAARGYTGSVEDMLLAYWKDQCFGALPAGLSRSDYERGAYIATSGAPPSLSISDLEGRYYTSWGGVPLIQDGVTLSLIDRRRIYWEGLL